MDGVQVWVVRGGDYNELAPQVKDKNAVAIGWETIPDIAEVRSRDELRDLIERIAPGTASPSTVGQLFRFVREIADGDYILTPEKATSTIHISKAVGNYRFDRSIFGDSYPHTRSVNYLKTVPRSVFPQTVRNTLGSVLTVFRADVALPHIESQLGLIPRRENEPEPNLREFGMWADEIAAQAEGQIVDALDDIDHHDFQLFVAAVLEAMGYRTNPGRKGKDGGVDILAYKDAFGLESPRIKVQTKNQKATAGVQEIGYLNGVLGQGERGLFVCTGGFSKDTQSASFVKEGRVALVDGAELFRLIVEHYDEMSDRGKRFLPLRRIYIPERPPLD